MKIERLIVVIAFAFSANVVHCIELEPNQNFPADVKKFIEDRESCDHFSSEPREFDTTYYQGGHQDGVVLDPEEVERAEFLEKMTVKTCYNMDKKLHLLNTKYRANPLVANKLSEYPYREIESGYLYIHKDIFYAELIKAKLRAQGFNWNVDVLENEHWQKWLGSAPRLPEAEALLEPLQLGRYRPSKKLTIYISPVMDVLATQLTIETLLDYGANDIALVFLNTENTTLGLYTFIGMSSVEDSYVYSGAALQRLLTPGLSKKAFRKLATSRATKRN